MKKIIFAIIIVLTAFVATALAEETINPIGAAAAGLLTNVVFPVLTAFLMALVGVVLNKLRAKFNLQISAENEATLKSLAASGIAYAEEKAASAVKSGVTKITGKEKLDTAIAYVMTSMPTVSAQQAEAIVTSVLGSVSGVGASGTTAVKQ